MGVGVVVSVTVGIICQVGLVGVEALVGVDIARVTGRVVARVF